MKIYFNGYLWHSGTGKTKEMSGISKFIIGASANLSGNYDGYINEFAVFNAELDASAINDYLYKKIDASHPFYDNLVAYYDFDEGNGLLVNDSSDFHSQAFMLGIPEWKLLSGNQITRNLIVSEKRPDVTFVQGNYVFHADSVLFMDSLQNSPSSLLVFSDTALLPVATDTILVWNYGWSYVYENDEIIDSVFTPLTNTIYNNTNTYWSEPFEIIDRYEIGRYITPYGIGLDLGSAGFTWVYDVSDYDFILRNEVDFAAGNQQELIDVKFAFIEGTPPRNLLDMKRIWGPMASYYFKDIDQPDDLYLNTIKYPVHEDAESFKIKTRITGHGHNSNTGSYPHCCEWLDNSHYLYVNDNFVSSWKIFQYNECALNPVYPQGGTWPGAREGWCPGDVVKDNEFEVADYIDSDSIAIDYDITDVPVTNEGMGWGNYVFAGHLFQYGPANFQYDAEIMDVITPNNWEYYSRNNPICSNPKIIVRNSGSETLNSFIATYSVSGGLEFTYEWTGSIGFMESKIIELPVNSGSFWIGDDNNKFNLQLSNPNGMVDENPLNNYYQTNFETPDIYTQNFIILFRTNNIPTDNYYHIIDINGDTVFSKTSLSAATTYYDTINLAPGCYELVLRDLGNDGLSYWAYTAQGTGYIRIKKVGGAILKYFESEFGHSIHYAFSISDVTNMKEIDKPTFEVFPNPNTGVFNIDLSGFIGKTEVEITNIIGETVFKENYFPNGFATYPINLQSVSSGIYIVNVKNKLQFSSMKIIVGK
ncbi:MAG: T9SS type A sorting domain-containing protein [Bacteroidales bacterium]|nr:T9SS type A sorting domain-containing protein [Bacteroidales bacterium]